MGALKGAFINIGAGLLGALPNIVVFQFNPEQMTRTPRLVQPSQPDTGAGPRDSNQQPAEPSESMSFTLKIDASDQLAAGNPIAAASGILPTLSALELLMVPKSSLTLNLFSLGGGAGPHLHPPNRLPTVLFFWGPFRLVPVNISSMTITETQYDPQLTPVRADVSVSLDVLTTNQLSKDATFARGAYKYSQGVKEVMAALNLANAVEIGVSSSLSLSI